MQFLRWTGCRDMNAKVGDVGLSRLISGTHLTTASQAGPRFTFNWASPEQIQCKPLTCASDIFSFGVCPAVSQPWGPCQRWFGCQRRVAHSCHSQGGLDVGGRCQCCASFALQGQARHACSPDEGMVARAASPSKGTVQLLKPSLMLFLCRWSCGSWSPVAKGWRTATGAGSGMPAYPLNSCMRAPGHAEAF